MKKLLFAVCALAAISMLTPSAGFAQFENRIGLYTTPTADAAHLNTLATFTPTNLYLLAINPRNSDGSAATFVDAFECTMTVTGPAYLGLSQTLPTGALDVDSATLGFAVGFATPSAVTNGIVLLMTWNIMMTGAIDDTGCPDCVNHLKVYLGPARIPSVPGGFMAINVPNSPVADPVLAVVRGQQCPGVRHRRGRSRDRDQRVWRRQGPVPLVQDRKYCPRQLAAPGNGGGRFFGAGPRTTGAVAPAPVLLTTRRIASILFYMPSGPSPPLIDSSVCKPRRPAWAVLRDAS
jgi:hypothetical protein